MPKAPRDVSHDALVRFLKKRGWADAPTGTKHTAYVKGEASQGFLNRWRPDYAKLAD